MTDTMKIVVLAPGDEIQPIFWISPAGKMHEVCSDGYLKDLETGRCYGIMPDESLKEIN